MALKITRKVGKNAHGQSASDVKIIQMALAAIKNKKHKPCYAGKIDGKAGPKTLQAICDFQTENKIKVTGVVETHGPTINCLNRKLPHSVKQTLEKASSGGSVSALSGGASGANAAQKLQQAEAKIKQQNEKLAKKIENEVPLPKEEAKSLAKAIRACTTNCLIPFDSDLAGPVDLSSDGRFVVKLKLDESSLDSGAAGTQQRKTMIKAVCGEIARSSGWQKGNGNDLVFCGAKQYSCLKSSTPLTADEMELLSLNNLSDLNSIERGLIQAMCFAVQQGAPTEVMNELEILSTIPNIPLKLKSKVSFTTEINQNRLTSYHDYGISENILANGCGPAEGVVRKFIPNAPLSFNFKPACDAHDINYSTIGVSKKDADLVFLKDMLLICKEESQKAQHGLFHSGLGAIVAFGICSNLAYLYYSAVAVFGDTPYKQAQIEALKEKNK